MNFENQPSEPFKQDINEYNPRYTFPLENQDDYRGLIRFLAYDEDYQSLAGLAFRTAAVAGVSADPRVSREVIDYFRAEGFSTKKGKANNKKNRGEIVLYLPQSIQISDNIQYGSIELGAIGATAMQGVAAGTGALGLVGDALKSEKR